MSQPPSLLQPPPTVPVPPPRDVPWWGALILAILVSIISVIGTLYASRPNQPGIATPPGVMSLFTDSILFLPHILILFGVLADIFTLQGAYSIPSLVGLSSIPINKLFSFVLAGVGSVIGGAVEIYNTRSAAPAVGGAKLSDFDGCDINGFEYFKSEYAPQGLVVTATVFWYYLLDLLMNRNILDSVLTWIAFIVFFGLQASQLKDCSNMTGSFFLKTFISLVEGFIIGGTGYGIVQASIPTRLPSSILPQGPSLTSLTKQANGTYVDAAGAAYIVGPDGRPIPVSFIQAAAGGS